MRWMRTVELSSLEPFQHLMHVAIRWEDGIPVFHDPPALRRDRQTFDQLSVLVLEEWKPQRLRKLQVVIAEQIIWQVHSIMNLLLIGSVLRRHTEYVLHTMLAQL